jgi:chromosome segregation ATPase
MQIANYQYKVDPNRDTYKTTQLDVEARAVFLRQLNANKHVANLLERVQSLTANVNGVQADIPAALDTYNSAVDFQKRVQLKITQAEAANRTLANNIETLRGNIGQVQTLLTKTKSDLDSTQSNIATLTSQSATIKENISAINTKIDGVNKLVQDLTNSLNQTK